MEPLFRVEVEDDATARWIRVHGDLDHETGDEFSRSVLGAPAPTPPLVVVDLTHCAFFDSGGVRSVAGVERHYRDTHRMVIVSPPGGPARLVLDLVGLGDTVAVVDHRDAVGSSGSGPTRP